MPSAPISHAVVRLRFLLLFLIPALITFEWQFVVARDFGAARGGAMLGLAASAGTLGGALLILALFSSRKWLGYPHCQWLVAGNSLVGLLAAWYWKTADWPLSLLLGVLFLQGVLNLYAMADEIKYVNQTPLPYAKVRAYGSVGYLAAVILSQFGQGRLFPLAVLLNLVLLFLPRTRNPSTAPPTTLEPSVGRALDAPRLPYYLAGFALAFIAKGFEIIGPIHLRAESIYGMLWLILLIAFEVLALHSSHRIPPKAVIMIAPLAWIGVYTILGATTHPVGLVIAMMLLAANCPAQTTIQTAIATSTDATVRHLGILASISAIGGFCAAALIYLFAAETPSEIMRLSQVATLLLLPIFMILTKYR